MIAIIIYLAPTRSIIQARPGNINGDNQTLLATAAAFQTDLRLLPPGSGPPDANNTARPARPPPTRPSPAACPPARSSQVVGSARARPAQTPRPPSPASPYPPDQAARFQPLAANCCCCPAPIARHPPARPPTRTHPHHHPPILTRHPYHPHPSRPHPPARLFRRLARRPSPDPSPIARSSARAQSSSRRARA